MQSNTNVIYGASRSFINTHVVYTSDITKIVYTDSAKFGLAQYKFIWNDKPKVKPWFCLYKKCN